MEAEPADAPVRAHFLQPYVQRIGSHEGCGCGFRSQDLALAEYERIDDVMALLGALLDDERSELLAEQGSRERLRDLVVGALRDSDVEVFACWDGDEALASDVVEEVAADHFVTYLDPLREGTKYVVRQTQRARP